MDVQKLGLRLRHNYSLITTAVEGHGSPQLQAALWRLQAGGAEVTSSSSLWRKLRKEVTELLEAALVKEAAAAEEASPTYQGDLAVEVAEALATRSCAHVGCTTITGQAAKPRRMPCSGCALVRYCSKACQVADWPAHKPACRELQRRQGTASSSK